MRALRVVKWLGPLLACALAGCEEEPDGGRRLSCDLPYNGGELQGEWTLRARGTRSDCDDRRLEGDLEIATSVAIEVISDAQATGGSASGPEPSSEADAFVERIERADYVLSLGEGAPSELQMAGEVAGACVSFAITEELPVGDELRYRFSGYITDFDTVEGDFTGEGPEKCRVTGSFELTVR